MSEGDFDQYKRSGYVGAECWTGPGDSASDGFEESASCLTPGHALSHAPTRGGDAPSRVLFLVGDSHAMHLVSSFGSALAGENLSFAYTARKAAGGWTADWPDPPPDETECEANNARACIKTTENHYDSQSPGWGAVINATLEAQLQPGDVLALSHGEYKLPHSTYIEAQAAFLRRAASMVRRKNATLLLLADVPFLRRKGSKCLTPETFADCETPRDDAAWFPGQEHMRAWHQNAELDEAELAKGRALHAAADAMHAQVAAEFGPTTVRYLPPSWWRDRMCTTDACGAMVPGTQTALYYDTNHLTPAGSLYLGPFLNCYLRETGLL